MTILGIKKNPRAAGFEPPGALRAIPAFFRQSNSRPSNLPDATALALPEFEAQCSFPHASGSARSSWPGPDKESLCGSWPRSEGPSADCPVGFRT